MVTLYLWGDAERYQNYKKAGNDPQKISPCLCWRRRRDSNPRGIAPKLISSQPRYDHFDISANIYKYI